MVDCDQLVAVAGDGIVVSDVAGAITLWNKAAERIFGFTEREALGQSLDLIVPERQRKRHWDGYHVTMSTGQTRYGAEMLKVPALTKDGRTISIAFTVTLLQDAGGKPTGIAAIVRDETARWTEERQLRRRLADLEAAMKAAAAPDQEPA